MPRSLPLTQSPAWQALRDHQRATAGLRLAELFEQDPARFDRFSLRRGDLLLDFSKNLVTTETMRLLMELARQCDVPAGIAAMFGGERINSTENRAVLHVALRTDRPVIFEGVDVTQEAARTFKRMRSFCDRPGVHRHREYRDRRLRPGAGARGRSPGAVRCPESRHAFRLERRRHAARGG